MGGGEMDPKLTILFLLIGTIIVISRHDDENTAKVKREFNSQRWLGIVPRWHKS
jgi:hypothetical protein